jgi:hypothetical protein
MTTPGYDGSGEFRPARLKAGTGGGGDPTLMPGQAPASLFGSPLPAGTGAPGSPGGGIPTDPTLESGQLYEGISGLGPADLANTGAPGSTGAQNTSGGGDQVTYTEPGSFLTATYEQNTISDNVSGTGDWTGANDATYGAGPQLPGIAGNQPTSTGAGQGRVMRGGRGA